MIVDFNHPLAGKNLVFEIEVVSKAKNDKEKILGIIEIFSNSKDLDVEIENESIKIKDKKKILDFTRKNSISETILKFFKNIKKVQFIDEYERES
ncbi:MAG: hypothetical protein B6U78_01305 [Candidatus Aenigmarchaeota archaeon ex4484_224]|nr:MAG: hypothetical protein B6U78_01305 [Candidatus Aenigmarchaeota archaeon ex4484_224]